MLSLQQSEQLTCVTYGVGGQPCCGLEAAEMAAAAPGAFGPGTKFVIFFETQCDSEHCLRGLGRLLGKDEGGSLFH